jgi:hypothetical protein
MNEPTIAVVVIGDGREYYLHRCITSMSALNGPIIEKWMYDDTGNLAYRDNLVRRYPEFWHINGGPRQGCAGAFQQVWRQVREGTSARFIFLIEQDFVFNRTIDLYGMAALLDERPHLAEVALRRQPWNATEIAAGGIVESHPDWYIDMEDDAGRQWLEHGAFFTTNCPLFRTSLLDVPWPDSRPGCYSEGTFHHHLMTHGTPEVPGDQVTYAYWGARYSGVWVEHIGYQRLGTGY